MVLYNVNMQLGVNFIYIFIGSNRVARLKRYNICQKKNSRRSQLQSVADI